MADLRTMCPKAGHGAAQLNEEAADAATAALCMLTKGESVDAPALVKPLRDVPLVPLPATPVEPGGSLQAMPCFGSW